GGATVFVVISVAGKFHNDHSKHIVFRTCYKIFDRDVNVRSVGARIALADFNGDGRLDFATMGYWVPGYYETEQPEIVVFKNVFAPT
ncbi:MAG: hypothetical protein D3903_21680, partial [Candidatus Electrothrix sp. GM3_4]|nr:hypothetical protein [Candidatus Electrothrix sp. GM3_4]